MKPTREQIAEARRQLGALIHERSNCVGDKFNNRDADAIAVLVAATEPPTDEELAEEAARRWPDDWALLNVARRAREQLRAEYAAGARREGRQ